MAKAKKKAATRKKAAATKKKAGAPKKKAAAPPAKKKAAPPAKKKKAAPPAKKKKAAPPAKKKAAPPAKKKAAPPAKKAAPKPPAPMEQADLMRLDGMSVPSRTERAAAVTASQGDARYAKVRETVLGMYRSFFPTNPPEADAQILETDPNDFDVDPSPFYETLQARFGLDDDPDNDYFGGFGGKVETTIANITKRWDGALR